MILVILIFARFHYPPEEPKNEGLADNFPFSNGGFSGSTRSQVSSSLLFVSASQVFGDRRTHLDCDLELDFFSGDLGGG